MSWQRFKKPSRKNLIVLSGLVIFAAVGVYMLFQSFAASPSSPTATAACGARVQNYTYKVPFGKAIWNQPICSLPRHPRSADYAERLYKWANLNDGVLPGATTRWGKVGSAPSFPDPPTLLDPEGLNNNWSRNVYFASEATTTVQVQSAVYDSNLDLVPYGDPRRNLPDARIPWNPAWRTGAAGDNEIVILDDTNGRIYGISGYKWDLAAITQCGPFFRDRICAYHVDVGRDFNDNYVDYRTYEGFISNRGVGLSYYATLVTAEEIKAGEIRHAMGVGTVNTALGAICTKAQQGTSAEGNLCGTAVAPASKFEWGGAPTLQNRCGGIIPNNLNALYTQDKLIPEGMLFGLNIDDAGIEAWINSRADLKNNARRAETARIFARAMRDYGIMPADTSCNGIGIQVEGAVNPRAAAIFREVGMGPEYPDNLLDGLITATNLYVVDPPTLTCQDGSKSKYFCKWTSASYGDPVTPQPDTTDPSVTITAPQNDAQVTGTVPVTITATDNVGVTKVEFLVDNVLKQTSTTSPYTYALNTTGLSVGNHTVTVKAYDAAGRVGQKSVTIKVMSAQVFDFNSDGKVGTADLAVLLSNYKSTVQPFKQGDCNGDGKVDIIDLSMLLSQYGK